MLQAFCRSLLLAVALAGSALAQRPAARPLPPLPASLQAQARAVHTPQQRAQLYIDAGMTFSHVRDSAGAVAYHRAAIRLGQQLRDSAIVGTAKLLLADYYTGVNDYERALPLAHQSERLLRHADPNMHVDCFTVLGEVYSIGLNQPLRGLAYLRRAVALNRQRDSTLQVAHVLFRMARLHRRSRQLDSARYYYLQTLPLYRAVHDSAYVQLALAQLGELALLGQHYQEADDYMRPANAWLARHGDAVRQKTVLAMLGRLARARDSSEAALGYFRQVRRLMLRTGQAVPLTNVYSELGRTFAQAGRPDSAEYYLRRAVREQTQLGLNSADRGPQLVQLATFYQQQGRPAEAEQTARQALAIDGGRPNATYTPDALQVLVDAAEAQGRFAQANRLLRRVQQFRDSLRQQENEQLSAELRIGFHTEQAEQRVRLLTQEKELARLRATQQLIGVSALAGLVVLLGGGLFWRYRHRQAAARAAAATTLRQRLAADLHDDVGNLLTQISMQSGLLRESPLLPAPLLPRVEALTGTARRATQQMSDAIWGLSATAPTLPELLRHMRDHAHEVLQPLGLEPRFDTDPAVPALPLSTEARQALYLIFKEALHNIVKHAQPTEVVVTLAPAHPGLTLTVWNDGPAAPASARPEGQGLASMQARAAAIGGRVRFPAQAAGFVVEAVVG